MLFGIIHLDLDIALHLDLKHVLAPLHIPLSTSHCPQVSEALLGEAATTESILIDQKVNVRVVCRT